jgi:hypothetical protein
MSDCQTVSNAERPACGARKWLCSQGSERFAVMDHGDIKLIVYTPLDTDQTAEKLPSGRPYIRAGQAISAWQGEPSRVCRTSIR